jgi:hypothetical protein
MFIEGLKHWTIWQMMGPRTTSIHPRQFSAMLGHMADGAAIFALSVRTPTVPAVRYSSSLISFLLVFLLFAFLQSAASEPAQEQPQELVRRVIQNELMVEAQDHSHWMFQFQTEKNNGQVEIGEVVETKQGDLTLPVSINGRELTPKQRQDSVNRLRQLVQHPEAVRKKQKDQDQDAERSRRLLKMLPDAFLYSYGERQGNVVQLAFRPNPTFRPTGHEEQVFHAMKGTLWVDGQQNRLAGISGQLMQEVRFGGGWLGHLDKGGTFEVKQEPVAPGYWELTLLNVHMNGKALFFKTIAVRQKYSRSAFRRVSDDLTAANGAEMLQKQVSSNRGHEP